MRFDEPLLTAADERDLARAMEAGVLAAAALADPDVRPLAGDATDAELRRLAADGAAARDRFVRANLRLAARLAHDLAARLGLPPDDLFQEACVGLTRAVDGFDHARGLRFSTYAALPIHQALFRAAVTRCGEVHLPRHRAEALLRAGESLVAAGVPVSLSWSTGDDEGERAVADPAAEQAFAGVERPDPRLEALLATLPGPERAVLRAHFGFDGEPRALAEVARDLGLSPSSARRALHRGLARLRAGLASEPAVA